MIITINITTCAWCKKTYTETEDYQLIEDYALEVCQQCIEETQPKYNYEKEIL